MTDAELKHEIEVELRRHVRAIYELSDRLRGQGAEVVTRLRIDVDGNELKGPFEPQKNDAQPECV